MGLFKTELEGFEPSRHLRGLPHFECGPLQPLGYNSMITLSRSEDGITQINLIRCFRNYRSRRIGFDDFLVEV